MDISHYTKVVADKIQKFEPEHVTKIIRYLLLQKNGEHEIVRLASCPDHVIHEVVLEVKAELQRMTAKSAIHPISLNSQRDIIHRSLISPCTASFQSPSLYYSPLYPVDGNANAELMPIGYLDSKIENDFFSLDASARNLNGRVVGRKIPIPNMVEYPPVMKTCHYFNKGYCRHGNNCRYYHGPVVPEISSSTINDDQAISLAQLESEIVELLKQRGNPISIASLPTAYQEKYNKVLQANGYLTESQRQGKPGCINLTSLLVQFRNSIRVIDRPHGQHSVVLAEDAPKFNISASQQIYLTFPADSTFSEEDVANYFRTFGRVEDVRIPCLPKRMYGFVTFDKPETVKMILDNRNSHHFVRGCRIVVKPYKEKPKTDRKYHNYRNEHPPSYSPHYRDIDNQLVSFPRNGGNTGFFRRLLLEEHERAVEFQRNLALLQLAQKLSTSSHSGINMNGSNDHFRVQQVESFNYAPNNNAHTDVNYVSDENSSNIEELNLPDNL